MKAWIPLYCLLAGSCDAATGALLLAAPATVYSLLGLAPLPTPAVYASFVGAFVLAVGLTYLYPFLLAKTERVRRWEVVFETTAISRLAVASFLTVAILAGAMDPLWGLVLFTDLSLALFQLVYLRRLAAQERGAE